MRLGHEVGLSGRVVVGVVGLTVDDVHEEVIGVHEGVHEEVVRRHVLGVARQGLVAAVMLSLVRDEHAGVGAELAEDDVARGGWGRRGRACRP